MSDLLKGNFKTEKKVKNVAEKPKDMEEKFEAEAVKRMGGSISFVAKKKVTWDIKDE